MRGKFAILIDGGFIKKKLKERNKHFPTVEEIESEVARIKQHAALEDYTLLRVYFYDAPPASGKLTNPVNGEEVDLSTHPQYAQNLGLQQSLEMQPDMALREGES